MSAGMNMEEAKKISEKMTYKEAVMNCLYARCVPYRKATKIKMEQLLKSIDNDFKDDLINQGYTKGYGDYKEDIFKCPKDELKDKCWIEQWSKELAEKRSRRMTEFELALFEEKARKDERAKVLDEVLDIFKNDWTLESLACHKNKYEILAIIKRQIKQLKEQKNE